jgi:hypothetical protein
MTWRSPTPPIGWSAIAVWPRRPRPARGARRNEATGRAALFLRNTAPNLAGAELSDLVAPPIETTADGSRPAKPRPRATSGRFRQTLVTVQFFATTPALAKILATLDTQVPTSWSIP